METNDKRCSNLAKRPKLLERIGTDIRELVYEPLYIFDEDYPHKLIRNSYEEFEEESAWYNQEMRYL